MLEFDGARLTKRLSSLSIQKRLAFMLFLCERMMPEFLRFAGDTGYGLSTYLESLGKGWGYLEGKLEPDSYENLARRCLDGAPDTEDFDHILTSAALNAALSIGDLMLFLADQHIDHIVEAAGLARDTVAMYVDRTQSVPPVSLPLDRIMKHPLVQQELRRQDEDLAFLTELPNYVNQETVPLLRERSRRSPDMLDL
jgi:uncharacterized protein YjaG (DUF416 family)